MGTDKALDSAQDESTDDGNQTDDQQLEAGDDQTASGDGSQETDGQEVDIVLPTDDGSPPKPQNYGFRKRINKLNARNEATEGRASDAESQLAAVKAENQLLKVMVDQHSKPAEADLPPDPNDFDDGAKDPGYVKALGEHNRKFIAAEFDKRAATQNAAPAPVNATLERRQTAHYEAAGKLGVKDYDAV